MPNKRTIDLLTESYKDQMTARRKYEFKNKNGEKIVDLYFKPLTRDDRVRAQSAKKIGFSGIITSAEYGATLGEVQVINVSFITNGAITSAI